AYPEAIAMRCQKHTLTYEELDVRSNQMANALAKAGVVMGKKVALYLNRDENMLPALLAVQKLGATYVPLDPSYPVSRIQYIIGDAGAEVVVCNANNRNVFQEMENTSVVDLETCDVSNQPVTFELPASFDAAVPVYMIYTSGSTGNPKGVRIPQHALLNFLTAMKGRLTLGPDDALLAVTSLAFYISGLELYLPLLSGACVVVAGETEVKSANKLAGLIDEHRITIMQGTPSLWQMLKETDWRPNEKFTVLCGGEALPVNLAQWFNAITGNAWNMYGPTETTIWSSMAKINNTDHVHIGTPIGNTQMFILDEHLMPLPVGHVGELYIGGDGLAMDYHNRSELTKEKFIQWQYKGHACKLFKTGDLARFNSDGSIVCLGRNDGQVKIQGYRIELGEVESKMMNLPEVDHAVVVVPQQDGPKAMVAYLKMKEELPLDVLRSRLNLHLPAYMIPGKFILVESFPLTPNGKVDRKALGNLQQGKQLTGEGYVAPRTEREQLMARLWEQVLDVEKVGINDNF
ncbi:MAG: amino acid adenylation domain-containing protein, partial [Flavobacteriales bacterium]|nr:amino acid adenylation domain-containing protein [Flavobacteriales bacterium]